MPHPPSSSTDHPNHHDHTSPINIESDSDPSISSTLEYLSLPSSFILSLPPTTGDIDLSNNNLISLCPLSPLASLVTLNISHNFLPSSSLSALSSLNLLSSLHVAYNNISSLSHVPPLPSLAFLDISFNPLCEDDKHHHHHSLLSPHHVEKEVEMLKKISPSLSKIVISHSSSLTFYHELTGKMSDKCKVEVLNDKGEVMSMEKEKEREKEKEKDNISHSEEKEKKDKGKSEESDVEKKEEKRKLSTPSTNIKEDPIPSITHQNEPIPIPPHTNTDHHSEDKEKGEMMKLMTKMKEEMGKLHEEINGMKGERGRVKENPFSLPITNLPPSPLTSHHNYHQHPNPSLHPFFHPNPNSHFPPSHPSHSYDSSSSFPPSSSSLFSMHPNHEFIHHPSHLPAHSSPLISHPQIPSRPSYNESPSLPSQKSDSFVLPLTQSTPNSSSAPAPLLSSSSLPSPSYSSSSTSASTSASDALKNMKSYWGISYQTTKISESKGEGEREGKNTKNESSKIQMDEKEKDKMKSSSLASSPSSSSSPSPHLSPEDEILLLRHQLSSYLTIISLQESALQKNLSLPSVSPLVKWRESIHEILQQKSALEETIKQQKSHFSEEKHSFDSQLSALKSQLDVEKKLHLTTQNHLHLMKIKMGETTHSAEKLSAKMISMDLQNKMDNEQRRRTIGLLKLVDSEVHQWEGNMQIVKGKMEEFVARVHFAEQRVKFVHKMNHTKRNNNLTNPHSFPSPSPSPSPSLSALHSEIERLNHDRSSLVNHIEIKEKEKGEMMKLMNKMKEEISKLHEEINGMKRGGGKGKEVEEKEKEKYSQEVKMAESHSVQHHPTHPTYSHPSPMVSHHTLSQTQIPSSTAHQYPYQHPSYPSHPYPSHSHPSTSPSPIPSYAVGMSSSHLPHSYVPHVPSQTYGIHQTQQNRPSAHSLTGPIQHSTGLFPTFSSSTHISSTPIPSTPMPPFPYTKRPSTSTSSSSSSLSNTSMLSDLARQLLNGDGEGNSK